MKKQPVKATMDWAGEVTIQFADGNILNRSDAKILYPECFKEGDDWVYYPNTDEKLPL